MTLFLQLSAKLERTRSSRGDLYVVIFQKKPKNSILTSYSRQQPQCPRRRPNLPPPPPTYSLHQRTPSTYPISNPPPPPTYPPPQRTSPNVPPQRTPPPPQRTPQRTPPQPTPNPRRNPLTFAHPPTKPPTTTCPLSL